MGDLRDAFDSLSIASTKTLSDAGRTEDAPSPPLLNTFDNYCSSVKTKVLHGRETAMFESQCSHVKPFREDNTMHILIPSMSTFTVVDVLSALADQTQIEYHNVTKSSLHPEHILLEVSPHYESLFESGVTVRGTHLPVLHPQRPKNILRRVRINLPTWRVQKLLDNVVRGLGAEDIEVVQVYSEGLELNGTFIPNMTVQAVVRHAKGYHLPGSFYPRGQGGFVFDKVPLTWGDRIEECPGKV